VNVFGLVMRDDEGQIMKERVTRDLGPYPYVHVYFGENGEELASNLIGAGYPFDSGEYATAARTLHDCETLLFLGNEYRVLAALLTPLGLSLWREKHDGKEIGRGRTAPRDLFRTGPLTEKTIDIRADSQPLTEIIAAEFDVVNDAVTEIEKDKAD
jgi:hypothetical protein